MSVLGTMMLRAGLLSEGQVAAVSEQAASSSSSEVDAILELGLADEDTLVAFLASKLMIPRVRSMVLERADQVTLNRLPPLIAWQHMCMPISADELGNLTVVMADPTNKAAIDAITEHTAAYLIRAVASVSDLRRSLERHYGTLQAVRDRAAAQVYITPPAAAPAQPHITQVYGTAAQIHGQSPLPPSQMPTRPPTHEGGKETELALTPIRDEPATPSYPVGVGIPEDDDDIPVRVGKVAEEVASGPHEQAEEPPPQPQVAAPYMTTQPQVAAAPYIASQPAAPYGQTAAPYMASSLAWSEPPPPAPPPEVPVTTPVADDTHTRPTMVETHTPAARGPRRARAFTPWNPPLAGPVTELGAGATQAPPQAAPYVAPEPTPEPQVAPESHVAPQPEPEPHVAPEPYAAPEPEPEPQAYAPEPTPELIIPLSPEAFAQVLPRLEAATDRDEVTTVLLDFLGAGFDRVILFIHSHNELRGHDARGKDLLVEAVRQVRIPTTGASMFSESIERGSPYFGSVKTANKIDLAFSQALGGLRGNVLLLPISLGSKVPLLLWAHGTNYPVDPRSINELSAAVSTAILRIISALRKG